jgi:hypothetical protein
MRAMLDNYILVLLSKDVYLVLVACSVSKPVTYAVWMNNPVLRTRISKWRFEDILSACPNSLVQCSRHLSWIDQFSVGDKNNHPECAGVLRTMLTTLHEVCLYYRLWNLTDVCVAADNRFWDMWKENVSWSLPDPSDARVYEITVKHLLDHVSGMTYGEAIRKKGLLRITVLIG